MAQSEAIGRLISLALRSGIDPREIVKQLKGISGSNPVWHDGELIRSTPDAIGKALERYLNKREQSQTELPFDTPAEPAKERSTVSVTDTDTILSTINGPDTLPECPECHEGKLVYEEGCLNCHSCGFSKCG